MALAFQFLGPPQLILENEPVNVNRRSIVALLAYLAVNDSRQAERTYTRESLSALLWPDYDQVKAFANLRHTLWEIQKAFGPDWLITNRETIGLQTDANVWVDVHRFESLLSESQTQSDVSLRIPLLTESVKLYRHHFLTGFNLKNSPTFDAWSLTKADELHHKLTQVLTLLTEDYCLLGDVESAVQYARRLVTLDPLNESAHRQLMQVYSRVGQHTAALKQYQTFEQTLRKEMGLDPQPETRALYKQIRKGDIRQFQVGIKKESIIPRNNLPHRLTTFIGRQQEQTEIIRLIAKNRLVTLVGAGGVGKSRLALRVAENLLGAFPNGVWLVELAPLTEPMLVAQAVCAALGITPHGSTPPLKTLTDHLASKKALLILDNCEHLIANCAQLAETLVQACPDLHILVTSREALRIAGERRYFAPSLSLPKMHDGLESIVESEAVKLFVERVNALTPNFELSETNAPIIAQICKRLDGIALAIELAAARIKLLKLEQLMERLDDAFQLLTGGSRTALPRHQTLRGTIDWSYNLLSEKEQALLQRLSVFMGGWTLEMAEEVCGNQDMLELLARLVDKSLVFVNHENGNGPRYYLHETIRQYALEKLIDSSEYAELRNKHRDAFLNFVEKIEPELIHAQQKKWLNVLESEIDNLRTAFSWSLENKDAEQIIRFCSGLYFFWDRKFHSPEAALACKKSLALVSEIDNLKTTFWYAATLIAYVYFTVYVEWKPFSDPELLSLIEQSHKTFASINNYHAAAPIIAGTMLAEAFLEMNNIPYAEQCLSNLYQKVKAVDNQWGIARVKLLYAQLSMRNGDMVAWQKLFQEALELYTAFGDEWGVKDISQQLIWEKYLRGEFDDAIRLSEQNILLYEKKGESNRVARHYITLGLIAFYQGKHETAQHYFLKSAEIWLELDESMNAVIPKRYFTFLLYKIGKLDEANANYRTLIAQLRKMPEDYFYGVVLADFALLCLYENRLDEAHNLLDIALEVLKKTTPETDVWIAYFGFGELARLENNYLEASVNYRACLHYANNYFNYKSFPMIFDGIAKTHCMLSNFEKATCLFSASEALRKKMGAVIYPVDRPDYDKHIKLLKSKMSTEHFEFVWAEGANMSIEEAYGYAMQE